MACPTARLFAVHQKISFKPNWICRDVVVVVVIRPAEELMAVQSLGAAVHNGYTNRPFATPPDRAALGCSPLFRESGAVGVRLSTNWSVLATVERLSNGGVCADNKGLTNVGARLGYSF